MILNIWDWLDFKWISQSKNNIVCDLELTFFMSDKNIIDRINLNEKTS